MMDENFSVISLRQGTVSGYSPRMRLDLVVNTMFKFAVTERVITVNNPAIWRPILSIKDAATAYIRAVESNGNISGIFNVASGNYTVGEIGDLVKSGVKKYLDIDVKLNIKHIQDYRNYKVSIDKAKKVLSFHPKNDVETIVEDLVLNRDKFQDFDNPNYYNIQVFKEISKK
jgi:nucleoside-diphosphate-sugar epimerase